MVKSILSTLEIIKKYKEFRAISLGNLKEGQKEEEEEDKNED